MTTGNTARQARFKTRQRAKGLRQIAVWVTAEQGAAIKAYLAGDSLAMAPLPVSVSAPATRRRTKRKLSADEMVLRDHHDEVIARIRRGEKPSALVVWLRQFGYKGSAAAFNTTFGADVFAARQVLSDP